MKRRKSTTSNQQASNVKRVQSADLNSKSSIKSLRSSPRNKRQVLTRPKNSRSKHTLETVKDPFKSLKSLFDVEKSFDLKVEDYQFLIPQVERKKDDSSEFSSEFEFEKPEDFIEKLKPDLPKLEAVSFELDSKSQIDGTISQDKEDSEFDNLEKIENIPILSEIEDNLSLNMSDNEGPEDNVANDSRVVQDNVADTSDTVEDNQNTKSQADCSKREGKTLDYPLPPGVGQGIPVGSCHNQDSIVSCLPITEPDVIEEWKQDNDRAKCIRQEIWDLKSQIKEIESKPEFSTEDGYTLRDLQTNIMQKISELNGITRKLERTIGLVDPSSVTFAKMFDMLPASHKGTCNDDVREKPCEDLDEMIKECEKFAFPQIDYPEDKLPRVILCGNTEENFPKIVIADSRPKSRGNKCVENLTGRLSESLSLQEKLAKENAELEGSKYRMEKELLEKDTAVECLQRKVCAIQAEMRLLVKDNSEMSKKLACLTQQKQQSNSCSPPTSSRSTPRLVNSARTHCQSPRKQVDLSCKCSARERAGANISLSSGTSSTCRDSISYNSPRLAGGGSRTDNCCKQNRQDMHHQNQISGTCGNPSRGPQRGGGAVCPAEIEEKLNSYGNNTKHLGEQLNCIETEVRNLQAELVHVKRERQQMEQQRKHLECGDPCNTCGPPPSKPNLDCSPCSDSSEVVMQQLRDLREQYARLQDDYKSKLCEVSRLRTDAESMRRETREAKEERERLEIKLIDAQERARVIESERDDLLGAKEQLIEQEQALLVAKQRFREAQDELEELRTMIRDQAAQLDDYRNKYLQAQQQVEEQRRQMDLMEMDNSRMNENVTLEIGRVKNQFQEKLAELAPLPDILKQTQIKLQETQQMRILAEHNCEDLSRELLSAKDKIDAMNLQINDLQRELETLQDENSTGGGKLEELEKRNGELRNENERLKNAVARCEEQQIVMQKRLDERTHEIVQLNSMLEQVREDSARQVARTKERCEAMKKSMQAQISDFEVQLAQCRAAAKTAQKERDEIRQKMQGQIGNLNEALQQAQGRIRSLQGHVDYLKVSYSNVFGTQAQENSIMPQTDSPLTGQGYDSCDCNY